MLVAHAGALEELARNLQEGSSSDRESAVALLSSLTMWIEHHDAMLAAGVLPALLRTVEDQTSVPQVSAACQRPRLDA